MAVTVSFVEWVSTETPGFDTADTLHDNFQLASAHSITAATNINLGNTSARDLTPSSFPIAAGSNSFHKVFALQFSGSFTQISNAKIWKSAGVYVTDEFIQFSGNIAYSAPATADVTDANIDTAQPSVNNVGLDFRGTGPGLARAGGAVPDQPATSRTLPHEDETNSSPGDHSGSRSSLIRFQLVTSASTPAGPVNQKTISLTYDRQ